MSLVTILTALILCAAGCLLVYLVMSRPTGHKLLNLFLVLLGFGIAIFPAILGLEQADFFGMSFRLAWILAVLGFLTWSFDAGVKYYYDRVSSYRREIFIAQYTPGTHSRIITPSSLRKLR